MVLVDLDQRFTAVSPGSGVADLPDPDAIAGAGNSFFANGDFEGGALAIVGSLEQALAEMHGDAAGGGGGEETPATTAPEESPGGNGLLVIGAIGLVAAGGIGATAWARRRSRHEHVRTIRRSLVDDDLAKLEPAGHELPRVEDYDLDAAPGIQDVATAATVAVLAAVESGQDVTDEAAANASWGAGLIAVVDRRRLEAETEVPLELRAVR